MKERPILMNGLMVRAVLAGTKTQTRRIAKVNDHDCKPGFITPNAGFVPRRIEDHAAYCPYGQPGDRLWVRETWAAHWMYNDVPPHKAKSGLPDDNYWHAADGDDAQGSHGCPAQGRRGKWRPSIHMPRWASRLTLEITEVRVERLNEISEGDAEAEGCFALGDADCTAVEQFRRLWESINGPGSWALNPFVWVITFRRVGL